MRELNYILPEGINDFSFFQIPTKLFMEPYCDIEMGAKVLYGVLLSRVRLSLSNGWVDPEGHVFIIYPNKELAQVLGVNERTITRYKNSLVEYGLLGMKKDSMDTYKLYVMNINDTAEEVQNDHLEIDTAEEVQNDHLEVDKMYELERTQCTSSDGHFVPENINKNNIYTKIECEGDSLTQEQYDELIVEYGSELVAKTIKRALTYKNCCNFLVLKQWLEEARIKASCEQPPYKRFEQRAYADWSELELDLLSNRPGAVPRRC